MDSLDGAKIGIGANLPRGESGRSVVENANDGKGGRAGEGGKYGLDDGEVSPRRAERSGSDISHGDYRGGGGSLAIRPQH
eukprot:4706871-Pleurochrysis_carterae.AAC.1